MTAPIKIDYSYRFQNGDHERLPCHGAPEPMVRFRLPSATLEETIFRMVSIYLLVQHYRYQDEKPTDGRSTGL